MCRCQSISGLQSETACHCGTDPLHGVPRKRAAWQWRWNRLAFLKIRTKWLGDSVWLQGKSSAGLGNLGWSFPFLSRKGEDHAIEPQLVATCCSYWPGMNLAQQQGAVGEKRSSSSGPMYCSNSCTASCSSEAKWGGNLLWQPWLLPTCVTGPVWERQLENWEFILWDFGTFKIKFQVEYTFRNVVSN